MQRYGTIVVVGGGCYGSYYVRQLRRAARAGALAWERVLVVDRSASCRVAGKLEDAGDPPAGPVTLVTRQWTEFFSDYLADAALDGESTADAIVPSPLMPHLMWEWLLARARARWPAREVGTKPLERDPPMPWHSASPSGTHYVSFAEWVCRINCIEPPRCPVTRGARSWSMPPAVLAYVEAERERGHLLAGPFVFHCTHRAYGVGMFDTRDVLEADRAIAELGAAGAADVLVGTVSHCHGALSVLAIGDEAIASRAAG